MQNRRNHEEEMDLARRRLREAEKYFKENFELQENRREMDRQYYEYVSAQQVEQYNRQLEYNKALDDAQNKATLLLQTSTQTTAKFALMVTELLRVAGGVEPLINKKRTTGLDGDYNVPGTGDDHRR